MKRGRKLLPIPSDFRTYYQQQKKLGLADPEIAEGLLISERTLYRWKQNLGIKVRK